MQHVKLGGMLWMISWLSGTLLLTGCREKTQESGSQPVTYEVRGVIREYVEGDRTIVIRHEEIPGYMAAMKMPFEARTPDVFTGLKINQAVQFKLHVVPDDSWVDSFVVLSNVVEEVPPPPVLDEPGAVSFYREVPELALGDFLPNYTLTNEFGKAFELETYRGKALIISFIFTRCPLPNFCPRMSQRMQEAQQLLKENSDAPKNWALLSVSFDPNFDTPAVLRGYGRRYQYDTNHWSLATGSYDMLQPLGTHFGLYFSRDVSPANLNHNLRTVVIDPQGKVSAVFIGNEWLAEELVDAVLAVLD
jgi:protein SCO1/2